MSEKEIMEITPSKLRGNIKIPPSKSIAHRAIICASLADGKSEITNISYSEDIKATISCMRALGAEIAEKADRLEITGRSGKFDEDMLFDCNESGSTLRFMLPLALAKNRGLNVFVGKGRLGSRPMDIYENICKSQGISYINESADGRLALKAKGSFCNGSFCVKGNVSSQFITGLMFALPILDGDSEITVDGELQSKGYLDLTLSALKEFGVDIVNYGYKKFFIKGSQKFLPRNYDVEGDWSQAAFYEVANYLGNCVNMQGLNMQSKQGDKVVVEFIERLKNADPDDVLIFDGGDCPDIIPVFALACCLRRGRSEIVNISRLRIKECDRLTATVAELKKLGADITENKDSMSICGVGALKGGETQTYNDHRMAMTIAIAATRASGKITFDNYGCVAKSYPDFFEDYNSLGGKAEIINKQTK